MVHMAEQEDPELTSFHGNTKMTMIYKETIDDKDQKTSRKDLLKDFKKEPQLDGQEGQGHGIVKTRT